MKPKRRRFNQKYLAVIESMFNEAIESEWGDNEGEDAPGQTKRRREKVKAAAYYLKVILPKARGES